MLNRRRTKGTFWRARSMALASVVFLVAAEADARPGDAVVRVGSFAPPPDGVRDDRACGGGLVTTGDEPEDPPPLRQSSVRLQLGPSAITTGAGLGVGATLAADFGKGSVGGRLWGAFIRGEGSSGQGGSTATGDATSHYGGEVTLDLRKRGPLHPVFGMGVAALHVSRPDGASGFAGAGTARAGLELALGLDDADVRVGAGVLGGLVGPAREEIRDLRGYVLGSAYLAIGF